MALSALIQAINRAVDSHTSASDVVNGTREAVGAAMKDEQLILDCAERTAEKAARCLMDGAPYEPLHIEHERCWRMALFLWEPGFTNPPHQHNTWSVSGVMHNCLEVALYKWDGKGQGESGEGDGRALIQRHRFVAERGQTGYLIPPCIHALGNPHSQIPSVTLHVFSDSEDCAQRANDTVWYDDVNAMEFYRDPARPTRRNLQTALVLLKNLAQPAPAGLLCRIFELGDSRIQLEAYKQLVRADLPLAVAYGDRLAAALSPTERSRFDGLHSRVKARQPSGPVSPTAEVLLAALPPNASAAPVPLAAVSDEDTEYRLQHAIGQLVSNPPLLERALSCGLAATSLAGLPAPTLALLAPTIRRHGRRLQIMAQMLDQRLLDQTLRLLPLTSAVMEPTEVRRHWRAFREISLNETTPSLGETCHAFCSATLSKLDPAARPTLALDVLRYESAMQRVGDRALAERQALGAPVAPPPLGPARAAHSETVHFQRQISPLIRELRAALPLPADARAAALTALLASTEPDVADEELLLFYVAWQDAQVRVLRLQPRTLLLARWLPAAGCAA